MHLWCIQCYTPEWMDIHKLGIVHELLRIFSPTSLVFQMLEGAHLYRSTDALHEGKGGLTLQVRSEIVVSHSIGCITTYLLLLFCPDLSALILSQCAAIVLFGVVSFEVGHRRVKWYAGEKGQWNDIRQHRTTNRQTSTRDDEKVKSWRNYNGTVADSRPWAHKVDCTVTKHPMLRDRYGCYKKEAAGGNNDVRVDLDIAV